MEITVSDGKRYQTQFYSLDAIIAVGYRVNSIRATQFRQWANPGLLRIPVEQIYEGGVSYARNPKIQNMLRMVGYGENQEYCLWAE